MNFDTKVPNYLKREQLWFGQIIGRPIDEDSQMNPISPSGELMEIEAAEHIVPSPTLRPAERIQIYNQQYWWRLLNTLHDLYPLVTRLFGYRDFNRLIAIPYLIKYPPNHWSLTYVGDRLPQWIEEEYVGDDKKLVYEAALVDWAFTDSFVAASTSPLTNEDLTKLQDSDEKLYTQPHLRLFAAEYDIFCYRSNFLKEDPEYWLNHDFPELNRSKEQYFILYRNKENDIAWRSASQTEYLLLNVFKQGASIEEACLWIEKQITPIYEEATKNLQYWFHDWTIYGWLSLR